MNNYDWRSDFRFKMKWTWLIFMVLEGEEPSGVIILPENFFDPEPKERSHDEDQEN